MASNLPDVVERFIADVSGYVRDVERAARQADRFGDQNTEAGERARRMGHAAQEAAERAARAQRAAAEEAERLARGQGDAERAAQAAARAQRELERAEMAQTRAARAARAAAESQEEQYRDLAREATRAAAAQRLAMLRASGAVREHNALLRRLREEYGDFGDDDTFREMERRSRRALNSISGMLEKIPMKFQAAIAVLPLVAAVAGGGIALAFGAGLSAVAIMAAAKSEQVKKSFTGLTEHVQSELRMWARPWEDTLVHMAGTFRKTFDRFQPTVQRVFADLAPAVQEFVDEVVDSFKHFDPVIRKFGAAFRAVLAELGPRMDTIMRNLAAGFSSIADAVQDNPEALAQFAEDLSVIARAAAGLIAILTRLSALNKIFPTGIQMVGKYKDLWNSLTTSASESEAQFRQTAQAIVTAATATAAANPVYSRQEQIMRLAGLSAQQLKTQLDALAGKELSAREAAIQYHEAIARMNQSLKQNGDAHGVTTAKGRANEQALIALTRASHANIQAMRDNKSTEDEVARAISRARSQLITFAQKMGYTRSQAIALADKLYGIRNAVNSIPEYKGVRIDVKVNGAGQITRMGGRAMAAGGLVQRFPTGGMVRGPGTSTSDSIDAALSNGEFVMNAMSTRRFLPLLEAMNRAGRNAVTMPARAPSAPAPMMARPAGGGQIVHVHHTEIRVAGSVVAERQLLDLVQTGAARRNIRNPGLPQFGGR